jgi:hypothetical protein
VFGAEQPAAGGGGDDLVDDQWAELLDQVQGEARPVVVIGVQQADRRVQTDRAQRGDRLGQQRVAVDRPALTTPRGGARPAWIEESPPGREEGPFCVNGSDHPS